MDEVLKYITSLGVLGVLAGLVAYLFWKFIPEMRAGFQSQLEAQQKQFAEMLSNQWRQAKEMFEAEQKTHITVNSGIQRTLKALEDATLNQTKAIETQTRAIEAQTSAFVNALLSQQKKA